MYFSIFLALVFVWSTSALEKLPNTVTPEHYKLDILTDLNEHKYYGEVSIQIYCKISTSTIKLHASRINNNLAIQDASVTLVKALDDELVENIEFDNKNELMVISLKRPLTERQTYILHIPFNGNLNDVSEGYYKVMYEKDKHSRIMAVTNMKYINARSVFPCFDEPSKRAVFSLRLGHRANYSSVSNVPIKTIMNSNPWVWDEYEDTPLMSTFQVAFSVVDRELKREPLEGTPTLGVYAMTDQMEKLSFAIVTAADAVQTLQGFFKVPFPLPKLDMIVIPNGDLTVQENWGMNLFINGYFDEDGSSTDSQVESKVKIIHMLVEVIAPHWLGNLVTTNSWDNYWFFSSVCTYIHNIIMQDVIPEVERPLVELWKTWAHWDSSPNNFFIVHKKIYDEHSYTGSIRVQVKDKGKLIIRMLHATFGRQVLEKALQSFVKKYAYKTAGPEEFWDILEEANKETKALFTSRLKALRFMKYKPWGGLTLARMEYSVKGIPCSDEIPSVYAKLPNGITVKEIVKNWIERPGYPVLYVKRLDGGVVQVSQERFASDKKIPYKSEGCWWIPLTYAYARKPQFENTVPKEWIGCKHSKTGLTIDTGALSDDWIIFNNKCSGLYRVHYDDRSWELIIKVINSPSQWKIHEYNRMQLVDDALSLAWSGKLSYRKAFELLNSLGKESSLMVWHTVVTHFNKLDLALQFTSKYEQFKKLARLIIDPIFQSIFKFIIIYGKCMKHDTVDIEQDIFWFACKIGLKRCVEQLPEAFKVWREALHDEEVPYPYPERMGRDIICFAIRYGNIIDQYEFVKKMILKEGTSKRYKRYYFHYLRCTTNRTYINELLEWTIDGSETAILGGGKFNIEAFIMLIRSSSTYPYALKFFYEWFDDIHQFLSSVGSPEVMADYVRELVSNMHELSDIDKMNDFLLLSMQGYPYQEICLRAMHEETTKIMDLIDWVNRNYDLFDTMVKEDQSESNTTPTTEIKNKQPAESMQPTSPTN